MASVPTTFVEPPDIAAAVIAFSIDSRVMISRAETPRLRTSIASLPPELRRRFTLGTFFFDLPAADEAASVTADDEIGKSLRRGAECARARRR